MCIPKVTHPDALDTLLTKRTERPCPLAKLASQADPPVLFFLDQTQAEKGLTIVKTGFTIVL